MAEWDLSASITVWAYFCNEYCHVYVYIFIYTHTVCHKRTICMHVCAWSFRCVQLWNSVDCSPAVFSVCEILWTRILELGCRLLLQGIFLIQVSNPGLLHYRQVLHHLSLQRSSPPGRHCLIYLPPSASHSLLSSAFLSALGLLCLLLLFCQLFKCWSSWFS